MPLDLELIVASAIISFGVSLYNFWLAYLAYASRRWPTVSGRCIYAGVFVLEDSEGGPPAYQPSVRYRYEVGGIEFESSRVRFGGGSGSMHQIDAHAEVARFGAGAVSVAYEPHRPYRSCLIPGPCPGVFTIPVFCFVVSAALAGAYLFMAGKG